MNNLLTMTDGYKFTHWKQYPKHAKYVMSYFESRHGAKFHSSVFVGLQYIIEKYLKGKVVTQEKINKAQKLVDAHIGRGVFNREGWEYILNKHDGCLPVEIKAIPEGMVITTSNALMTIENTDPKCYWLPNYLETLLVQNWYPITVATQSREMKKYIKDYLVMTASGIESLDFKLHDFGFRGVSSPESAAIGGFAHLVNFLGSDTTPAIEFADEYYGEEMAAFSIPAAEHSTITSWGKENEVKAFKNMLDKFPTGLIAVVSDSYDIYHACRQLWGIELKNQVLARDGILVIRPDSGNPLEVVPNILDILGKAFGYETNEKGFKELPPQVRVIQGDNVTFDSGRGLLAAVKHRGWSTDMLAFGMGGALLQRLNRDTQNFVFKCCNVSDGKTNYPVSKDPVTDHGKKSKEGRLKLIKVDGAHGSAYTTISEVDDPENVYENLLNTVFKDGVQMIKWKLKKIRETAAV